MSENIWGGPVPPWPIAGYGTGYIIMAKYIIWYQNSDCVFMSNTVFIFNINANEFLINKRDLFVTI